MLGKTSPSNDDLEFRVLTGTQAGASFKLIGASYLVGAGEDADILLDGTGIAPAHLRIGKARGSFFSIEPVDGAVDIDTPGHSPARLRPGTVLRLGNIAVTVDLCSAPWSTPAAVPLARHAEADAAPAAHSRRWFKPSLLVAVCASSIFMVLPLGLAHYSGATPREESDARATQIKADAIHETLVRRGLGSRVHVSIENGRPVLRGYVTTQRQLDAALKVLGAQHGAIVSHVVALDTLKAKAGPYLAQEDSKLKVNIDEHGIATLSGVASTRAAAERMARNLQQHVASLKQVKVAFATEDRLEDWISTWHKQTFPDSRMRVRIADTENGDLELVGDLAPGQRAALLQSLNRRAGALNVVAAIDLPASTLPSASTPATVPLRAVSRGAVPYALLQNGERLFLGGTINGLKLVSIGESGPVFAPIGG